MHVSKSDIEEGVSLIELLSDKTAVFPSRGEARKLIQAGGVSINKEKISDINTKAESSMLLNNHYILVQKGKKNYYLLVVG